MMPVAGPPIGVLTESSMEPDSGMSLISKSVDRGTLISEMAFVA